MKNICLLEGVPKDPIPSCLSTLDAYSGEGDRVFPVKQTKKKRGGQQLIKKALSFKVVDSGPSSNRYQRLLVRSFSPTATVLEKTTGVPS